MAKVVEMDESVSIFSQMKEEIGYLVLTCKEELTIFSSIKILSIITNESNIVSYISSLLEKNARIKILVDSAEEFLVKQIAFTNKSNLTNSIQLGYTDKLGDLDEMIIISDNKYLLHIRYGRNNKLIATFSNEEHSVLVQELMFEKYWNELKSLNVMNGN
jgi:hypothetical protein